MVNGVSNLWWEIVRKIRLNPDLVHQFDWRVWEEIVAGAYKEDGWSTVILTPRSGDKGRDVIAKKEGHGELRFLHLDQVKAFGPNEKVGPSDIREMIGVLSRERGATKGIITTTGTFTAGAIEEASTFDPRLELRPRIKLVTWLARLMKNRNRKLE